MSTLVDADVPLAVYDYLPVALTAAGAWLLGDRIGRRAECRVAAGLLLLGGGMKATWKLMLALQHRDYGLLFHGLFPCLSVAFALLLLALGHKTRIHLRAWPGVVVAGLVLAVAVRDDGVLLVTAALGSVGVGVLTAILGRRRGSRLAPGCAVAWVVGSSALAPLATHVQTTGFAWVEQSLNALTQGLFLLAAGLLPSFEPQPLERKELLV